MEHERLAGPRMLTFAMLWTLAVAVALFLGFCGQKALAASPYRLFVPAIVHGGGVQYQACAYSPTFPVRLHLDHEVDLGAWRHAMAEWNTHAGFDVFVEDEPATVRVQQVSGRTWVRMGACLGGDTVVYSGDAVWRGSSVWDWAPHELGHVLGLRDLIRPGIDDPSGYINPGLCPADGYVGIMSYCATILDWWGADDDAMIKAIAAY